MAVFGPDSPKVDTPQQTVLEPSTVYGISKVAGESWCAYYHKRYGVDVRSVRYPGLIGSKGLPGGGTTDYAVHIFYAALQGEPYTCFLSPEQTLPMMHMDDAVRATIGIMQAPAEDIKVRSSYNIAGMSFSPAEIASAIQAHVPGMEVDYAPDEREQIAASWPDSIDDQTARQDWGWQPQIDLQGLVKDMLDQVQISEPS